MKRLMGIMLCAVMVVGLFGNVTVLANTEIRVTLNGVGIEFDVPPQMVDNRTMVPLRAIFYALGAGVAWDGDTQTVTATRGDVIVVMQVGNPVITVNGNSVTLDVPPLIIDGRTLVPARAVAESFGVDVQWNPSTRTVTLTTDAPAAMPYQPAVVTAPSSLVGSWYPMDRGRRGFEIGDDGTGFAYHYSATILWRISGEGAFQYIHYGEDWNDPNVWMRTYQYSIDGDTLTLIDESGAVTIYRPTPSGPPAAYDDGPPIAG